MKTWSDATWVILIVAYAVCGIITNAIIHVKEGRWNVDEYLGIIFSMFWPIYWAVLLIKFLGYCVWLAAYNIGLGIKELFTKE